jgi:tetratricopeptide (TPR) repeat protein
LNPSLPEAHGVYARYLRTAGNVSAAVEQRKQALALDPFRADLREQLGLEYYFARNFQAAVALARDTLASDPDSPSGHAGLCVGLGRFQRFDESVAECSKALGQEGHAHWTSAYLREYQKHGYSAAELFVARRELHEILKSPRPDLWELANAYVLSGEQGETIRALFRGLSAHEPGLLQIRVDPDFDSIRSDPRYAELVRQIGFPDDHTP